MLKKILKSLWSGWKKFAHILGKVNSFILLTLFYFTIFAIVGLLKNFFKLFDKKPILNSFWIKKQEREEVNFEQQF